MKPLKMFAVVNADGSIAGVKLAENIAGELRDKLLTYDQQVTVQPVLVVPDGEVREGFVTGKDQYPMLWPDKNYESPCPATLIVHRAGEATAEVLDRMDTAMQRTTGIRDVESTIVSGPMDGTSPRISAVPQSGLAQRMLDQDLAYGVQHVAQLQRQVAALTQAVLTMASDADTYSPIKKILDAAFPEGR